MKASMCIFSTAVPQLRLSIPQAWHDFKFCWCMSFNTTVRTIHPVPAVHALLGQSHSAAIMGETKAYAGLCAVLCPDVKTLIRRHSYEDSLSPTVVIALNQCTQQVYYTDQVPKHAHVRHGTSAISKSLNKTLHPQWWHPFHLNRNYMDRKHCIHRGCKCIKTVLQTLQPQPGGRCSTCKSAVPSRLVWCQG